MTFTPRMWATNTKRKKKARLRCVFLSRSFFLLSFFFFGRNLQTPRLHTYYSPTMSTAGARARAAEPVEPGRIYDLTIFGATGFTGKYILDEVLKIAPKSFPGEQQLIRVAVARRSRVKLERLVAALSTTGEEAASRIEVDIIVADVQDERSMRALCRVSKAIIAAGKSSVVQLD